MNDKSTDLRQVGVTPQASGQMKELKENTRYFATEQDIYRLGVAVAIALDAQVSESIRQATLAHKFRVHDDYSEGPETSRLDDPTGRLALMISTFRPEAAVDPYRQSQYLASIGINHLHGQILSKGKTLAEAIRAAVDREAGRS